VLHSFIGGTDGAYPQAPVVFDKKGALYTTTSEGGTLFGGTVLKLTPTRTGSWEEAILWSFGGTDDGSAPFGPVIMKKDALYGTTVQGGADGEGTVYQIKHDKKGEDENQNDR
jgi:hypothetical protein